MDATIFEATITFRYGRWVRTGSGCDADWRGPIPTSFDDAVSRAMRGEYDEPETQCRIPRVCASVIHQDHDEDRTVYTGLVRRCREGLPGAEAAMVAHVRRCKTTGDVSPRHNCSDDLPPRAAKAVELVLARAWGGLSRRLSGSAVADSVDGEAVDRRILAEFDREWASFVATL